MTKRYEKTTHNCYQIFDNQEDRFMTIDDAIDELNDLDDTRCHVIEQWSNTLDNLNASWANEDQLKSQIIELIHENKELKTINRDLKENLWELSRVVSKENQKQQSYSCVMIKDRRKQPKWKKPFPLDYHNFL